MVNRCAILRRVRTKLSGRQHLHTQCFYRKRRHFTGTPTCRDPLLFSLLPVLGKIASAFLVPYIEQGACRHQHDHDDDIGLHDMSEEH